VDLHSLGVAEGVRVAREVVEGERCKGERVHTGDYGEGEA